MKWNIHNKNQRSRTPKTIPKLILNTSPEYVFQKIQNFTRMLFYNHKFKSKISL